MGRCPPGELGGGPSTFRREAKPNALFGAGAAQARSQGRPNAADQPRRRSLQCRQLRYAIPVGGENADACLLISTES